MNVTSTGTLMDKHGFVATVFKHRVKILLPVTMAGPGADLLLEVNADWLR